MEKNNVIPKVGEVWLVDVTNAIGHQQAGRRPYVITSNNKRNAYSPMVKAVPLSKQIHKRSPVHVLINRADAPYLSYDSIVLCEEVVTLNKTQLIRKLGALTDAQMTMVAIARVQDEPFLYKAFTNNVQSTEEFKQFSNYA